MAELRPLPDKVFTLAGEFEIETSRDMLDQYLANDVAGEVWFDQGKILLDIHMKRLRAQWSSLIHEAAHIKDVTLNMGLTHDNIFACEAFWTDFLERNQLLNAREDE